MTCPGDDAERAAGLGAGQTPTLPPRTVLDQSLEPDDDAADDLGDSGSMQALLAAVAAAPPVRIGGRQVTEIVPGTLVDGTYRVQQRLGGGGMGVVYLAEHVELQRRVALKLHLGELDSQELARLRREARVMARLAHPNVLGVHGVGTHEGRMFIAMEYADGGTLKAWLEAGPRPWRETVAMLVQAGRGLAAAHRVGVVHRDFKPDNVLIGADARPRVADFGLARRWDDAHERATDPGTTDAGTSTDGGASLASASGLSRLDDARRFTVTGAVVGTPAYMSPEQFDGIDVGPASDQFSFCVVLYEALLGRRPFSGRTTMELAAAVHTGALRPIPPGVRVPGRLLALVTRGLRPVPGDRHATMDALVDALERVLGARARRARWATGGLTLGAALLVGNRVAVMAAPAPCEGVEQGLEAAWGDARREAVAAAWPSSLAAEREPALAAIDAWAAQWGAQRRETCERTRVREEQSDRVFTLRMACLDRMAARLDGLTDELAAGSVGEPSAALVGSSLPALAECEDVEALDLLVNRFSSDSMRADAAQDRAWVEADGLLTRALARRRLGRPGAGALAEQALALAQRHALPVVESEALASLADERLLQGDADGAAELAVRGLGLALRTRHDAAALELVLGRAEAALAAGRLDEAELHLSYFGALRPRVQSPGARASDQRAQGVRGRVVLARGDAEAALRELGPLADDASLDASHRSTVLTAIGAAHEQLGHVDQAIATWERMVALVEAEQGPDAPELAALLNNIATARAGLGQLDAALELLARAETLARAAWGEPHPLIPVILSNRGEVERKRGRLAEARALQEQSLALRTRIYGDAHPSLSYPLGELGELARLRGDGPAALELLDRARRLREQSLGAHSPLVAETLTLEARVHLDLHDEARAEGVLRQAYSIVGQEGADPVARARVELLLAEAGAAGDPTEARRWAKLAHEHAVQGGAAGDAVRDEVDAWLAAHRATEDPTAGPE